jgi:hypothetical protein
MYSNAFTRLLAVSVAALFLSAASVHGQTVPPPPDSDGDGVTDDVDECPSSNFAPTVLIHGVDTGIANTDINAVGCTLADLIDEIVDMCVGSAKNHGQFVRCVSHETNILKRARTISGKQKGKMQSIVARLRLP